MKTSPDFNPTTILQSLDPYEILNVKKNASFETIKKHYRALQKKWHPDKVKEENPEKDRLRAQYTEITKKLNSAYETLSNAENRKKYDIEHGISSASAHSIFSQPFGGDSSSTHAPRWAKTPYSKKDARTKSGEGYASSEENGGSSRSERNYTGVGGKGSAENKDQASVDPHSFFQILFSIGAKATLPDGNLVVGSAAYNDHIKIYNPTTGALVRRFGQNSDGVNGIAILPDGNIVVGGAAYNAHIRIYNPITGALVRRFGQNGDGVNGIAILPDGNIVVGGATYNDHIRIYNPTSGALVRRFGQNDDGVNGIAILPDGNIVVGTSQYNGHIRIYNPTTGAMIQQLPQERSLNSSEEVIARLNELLPECVKELEAKTEKKSGPCP